MTRLIRVSIIMALVFLLLGENVTYAGKEAPSFTLPKWGTEKQVSLDDLYGKIVVLDFFNVSCAKCFRASWELQIDIQEFYAPRSGNPNGIEVQVVAVNSEVAESEDMGVFLEETELDLVLDDSGGKVLQRYGGTTVPYIVVIDAASGTDAAAPRVVYQSGYEGLKKLRDVIDAITGHTEQVESRPGTQVDKAPGTTPSLQSIEMDQRITHETALDTAALIASDVSVIDTLVEYQQKRPSMEFTLALSYRHMEMDYASEYLAIRRERNLSADFFNVQSSASFDLNKNLTLTIEGGIYDGFQTYRALWLDAFYLHVFDAMSESIDDLKGYKKANPWGYNMSSGLRWEYLPSTAFAEAGISFQHDIVSPGYETGISLVRLRDNYDTVSGYLTFENILTRRLRTLVKCRIDDITDRDVRFTLQGSINYALAEHWVTRLVVAGAKENPHFRSKSINTVLERDWHDTWFVNLFGRYYEDTSEIENAVAGNAAAPPLQTYQAGLGIRRQGHQTSFKFVIGPCFSRYEKQSQRDRAFDQLYKDRDWLSVQFAFLHQF